MQARKYCGRPRDISGFYPRPNLCCDGVCWAWHEIFVGNNDTTIFGTCTPRNLKERNISAAATYIILYPARIYIVCSVYYFLSFPFLFPYNFGEIAHWQCWGVRGSLARSHGIWRDPFSWRASQLGYPNLFATECANVQLFILPALQGDAVIYHTCVSS